MVYASWPLVSCLTSLVNLAPHHSRFHFSNANLIRLGNVKNVTTVTPAATMVNQDWFKTAISSEHVDLFVVLGHNPARTSVSGSTFGIVHDAIRAANPRTPIQFFG